VFGPRPGLAQLRLQRSELPCTEQGQEQDGQLEQGVPGAEIEQHRRDRMLDAALRQRGIDLRRHARLQLGQRR